MTTSLTLAPVATWTTKAGTTITAHCNVDALRAPVAVRAQAAQAADLAQWANGQYRPITAALRACLTDKQALQVASAATLNPGNKPDMLRFLAATATQLTLNAKGVTVTPKGHKARMHALCVAILEGEAAKAPVETTEQLLEMAGV